MHKLLQVLFVTILTFSIFAVFEPRQVSASAYDDLIAVQKKLAELKKQKQDINARIDSYKRQASSYSVKVNALSAEISLLDADITEKQLQIDELSLSIKILQEEIDTNTAIISQTEYDIEQMQFNVDGKIKGMYLDYKTGIGVTEVDASLDSDDVFKKLQYKGVLIEQTKELVDRLNVKMAEVEEQKIQLEEKNQQLKRDLQAIDETKAALDSKKAELVVQRQAFYNLQEQARRNSNAARGDYMALSEQEAKTRAEEQLLLQQIFRNTGSIPNGAYVKAGTLIAYQGNTGISTGHHLHFMVAVNGASTNPCTRMTAGPLGGACSGDGTIKVWPMQGSYYFTSGYGNRCYNHNGYQRCSFHDGIDLASPNKNAPIYAAHDGWMQKGSWACNSSLCNGPTKYVIICENKSNCNSGLKTAYMHVSGYP